MSSPHRELTPRQRKSRSGCKRCKERRVKCDEAVPSCHQCRRQKVECPGYKRGLCWVQHQELSASGLRVFSNTKNGFRRRDVETKPCAVDSNFEAGLPAKSPRVPDVIEQQLQSSIVLDDESVENDHIFHDDLRFNIVDDEDLVNVSHTYQSISPELQDNTTFLVEYYFSNVCHTLSCFDSPSNPFRYEISTMMRSSPALSHCIQSMSAAHLSKLQPSRRKEGLQLQNAAVRSISDTISSLKEVSEELLVSVTLLGVTQGWHNRYATGSEHFAGARTLFPLWLSKQMDRGPSAQIDLIIPMMIYWEMLASFVMKDGNGLIECLEAYSSKILGSSNNLTTSLIATSSSHHPVSKIRPHPVTGATPKIFILFAKVGHLVRQKILDLRATGNSVDSDSEEWDHGSGLKFTTFKKAQDLEEALLTYENILEDDVEPTNDVRTPVSDLLCVAEAYRSAALLQVYRVFPSLLKTRLPLIQSQSRDSPCSMVFEGSDLLHCTPATLENIHEDAVDQFLFALSTKILKLVAETSTESGTRTMLPLILVMAANELRLLRNQDLAHCTSQTCDSVDYWRLCLWSRLTGCVRYLSIQPMNTTMDIVKELWRKLDSGKRVFWLEVVLENGWETLMG